MTFENGFPPFYETRPTSAFYDVTQAYVTFTAIALFIGMLLVLPGVRGKDRGNFIIRWSFSLFTGTAIIVCVFGLSWHKAVMDTYLPSSSQGNKLARFEVGLYVGLTSYNVTFRETGDDVGNNPPYYNEDFYFLESDADLKAGLKRGLPAPILNVAEFFTTDSMVAMNVWARRYWIAGRYAQYLLWSAFANWIVGNILLSTFVKYGGLSRILGGFMMLGANISFASVNSFCCELRIHLGFREPAVLHPSYGWSFWLCMCVGLFSVVSGIIITSSSYLCSVWIHHFFSLEITVDEPLVVEFDKSPRSSTHSISSQHAKEEPHSSKDEKGHPSSGELSRRESLQKMEVLEMDPSKASASNGRGDFGADSRDDEGSVKRKPVTTTDL